MPKSMIYNSLQLLINLEYPIKLTLFKKLNTICSPLVEMIIKSTYMI